MGTEFVHAFNRTSLELKHRKLLNFASLNTPFNRTSLELKRIC